MPTGSFVREHNLGSWTRPLSLPASPLGSGTRSDARCAAASVTPSCPLPEPHRPNPVGVQCSSQVVECGAVQTAVAQSQSQKMTLSHPKILFDQRAGSQTLSA